MKLSDQDADLFFELMFPLQAFANQQLGILPEVRTPEQYLACPMEQKLPVRDALYENVSLIDQFIEQNPHQFSGDALDIIAGWKQFIAGEFYIERMLKRYAIFITSGAGDRVYGVLGLHDAFQDMIHPSWLPVLVKTVLLPFKGKIVYDGLLQPYNVIFGRGISSELKEDYMAAKQQGRIIESLESGAQSKQRPMLLKDWRPEIDALASEAQKLRSSAGQPPLYSPAFSLLKAILELAQSAVHNPDDLEALWKSLEKVERAATRVETTLHRSAR